MKRFNVVLFLMVLFSPAALCAGETSPAISICGSGDNQELIRQLARAYEGHQPGIRVEVPDSIGSSGGVKATAQGQCDVGRLARPLRDKEKRYQLSYKLFARSPVVFLVSANLTSMADISAQQVVRIFSGKMTSWEDMGGPAAKIYIANREKGDSSRTVLEKHMIDFALIEQTVGKTIYSTPETVDTVAGHDNTIAYAPLSAAFHNPKVHVLAFDGVIPSAATIAAGKYPLYVDFGLVWRADIRAPAKGFLAFLETSEAKAIICRYGAAPVVAEKL
ncbi:MAG: substrate-binding domain-containing protein [Proteobacteria bacterium]|nr:substrate-binding domain-containing protein [Pseudomonadota bacterium]MBU1641193.1 substrate-binding domain-containing protein [Pseudomonadota bacterium]